MNADSSLLWFILLWLIISCGVAFSVWSVLGKALSKEALYAARTVIRLAALVGPLFVFVVLAVRHVVIKLWDAEVGESSLVWVCMGPSFVAIHCIAHLAFLKRAIARKR
jgi:hypothetical protein